MLDQLPYCGLPPVPGALAWRLNLDPILLAALFVACAWHLRIAQAGGSTSTWRYAAAGWLIGAGAFVSPLCALSVALFSARVGQHMILVLLAAPLIALAWPPVPLPARRRGAGGLWASATAFFVALWLWHMPGPYDATFSSTLLYWTMHVTLFGSSILLWRELLHHRHDRIVDVLAVGALTSMQMGLLGAVLTFATRPLFLSHLTTTAAWGVTPLHDQQLGGVFMWVPGMLLFLWAAIRSLGKLWNSLEGVKPA
jgi:putative membrane protein